VLANKKKKKKTPSRTHVLTVLLVVVLSFTIKQSTSNLNNRNATTKLESPSSSVFCSTNKKRPRVKKSDTILQPLSVDARRRFNLHLLHIITFGCISTITHAAFLQHASHRSRGPGWPSGKPVDYS
jgi:hypothetical protein